MTTWSSEQLKAINTVGKNVLVSASAGAGKTSVLVERLTKRCLIDKVSLNKIVAMTFTEAAASEMKKRLSASLHSAYETSEDKEYILQQLVYLENANITTIDSFCLSIIKKYYDVIGLDPVICTNILSEGALTSLKNQAFLAAYYSFIEEEPEAALSLSNFFSSRSEEYSDLKNAVDSMYEAASSSFDEEGWYRQALDNYHPIKTLKELPSSILSLFYDSIALDLHVLKDKIRFSKDLALKEVDESDKFFAAVSLKEKFLDATIETLNQKDYSSFLFSLRNMCTKSIGNSKKNYSESLQKMIDSINKTSDSYLAKYFDEEFFVKDSNAMYSILSSLIKVTKKYEENVHAYKLKEKGMDFSDMSHYAYAILTKNDGMVSELIKKNYEEILVDEFQDTNEIQNEIINLIASSSNAFRVGDVKQSIYRFRKAKPELMRNMMHDTESEIVHLSDNYRSKENIVNFSNELFERIMNVEGCLDTYSSFDHVSAGTKAQKEYEPNTIKFYALLDAKKEEEESDIESLHSKELKANFIAKDIKQKQSSGKYSFHDFVVLVRSHAEKPELRKAFENYGIPYYIDAKEGFYQSELCLTILSFIRILLNPHDSISLVSVLRSPFYSMSEDDLASLKLQYSSIYQGLVQTKHPLLDDIQTLTAIYKEEGIAATLNHMVMIHSYLYEGISSQQRTNFDMLYSKAVLFEKTSTSLIRFVEEIEANLTEKSSEAVSISTDDDVVRVVTIHQSKGLQYRVVYFWSTSLNRSKDTGSILIDADAGVGLKCISEPYRITRDTPQRLAIKYKASLEDQEEFTRLLYVALTRAQEEMYMVDTVKEESITRDITLSLLSERKGTTNLILSALSHTDNFNVEYIEDFEHTATPSFTPNTIVPLPHYQIEQEEAVHVVTPSTHSYGMPTTLNLHSTSYFTNKGTLVHSILEKLPNRIWTKEDLASYSLKEEDKEKILSFSQSSLYKDALTKDIHKEYPFYAWDTHSLIHGVMDFVAIGDKDITLIDFKTDTSKEENHYTSSYTQQILYYKKALQTIYPNHTIHGYVYSFSLGKEIAIQ